MSGSVRILVDADACPVKDEVYRVAWRREVPVRGGQQQPICACPTHPLIERVVVSDGVRRRRRLDRRAGGREDGGDHRRHPARRPLPEGGRDRHRPQRQAVHAPSIGAPSRRGRSWPTCAPAATRSAGRRRSPRRTARGSCRRWTRRWCGWRGDRRRNETPLRLVHDGSEILRTPMQTQNIIERAFQLARGSRQSRGNPEDPPAGGLFQRRRAPWRRIDQGRPEEAVRPLGAPRPGAKTRARTLGAYIAG